MKYYFMHVTNKEILEKVHRFRYKIMYDELGWIKSNPNGIETDAYDRYCDQFAILNDKSEICCTMRLIHHSPIGYPTERFLDLDQEKYQYERDKLSEMSRIFIHPRYRNMSETKIFISSIVKSLAYEKIKEYKIEYCYGMLEEKFLKLVNMFKIPYQSIADIEEDYDKLKYPSILYVKELQRLNPQLEKSWEKNKKISVLDLELKIKPEQIIIY